MPAASVTDAFGVAGQRWLARLDLPEKEAITLAACLGQIDALDVEVKELDRLLARRLVDSPEARRLLSVPGGGVNLVVAATFLHTSAMSAAFPTPAGWWAASALTRACTNPANRVPVVGTSPSKGAGVVRQVLGQAAWRAARLPGPLPAFYERIRARRGPQVAATALARELATLFWHLLTREEDYAFAIPPSVRRTRRALELMAGDPPPRAARGPRAPGSRGRPSGQQSARWPLVPSPPTAR